MKRYFAPNATEPVAAVPVTEPAAAPAPTSEKLVKLQDQYNEAWTKMLSFTDGRSKEALAAKMEVWKIDGEIKAEEQAIVKAANDAKIAELKNERLKLNQTQLDAYKALVLAQNDKKADPAKIAELETIFNTAREAVDNELLAKYAHSKPAKTSDGTVKTSDSGAEKQAILQLARDGKTQKEIIAAGYARSTVWHAIDKAKKAGETFANV